MHVVVAFTEGELAEAKTFESLEVAGAWAAGFSRGGHCYGAASCAAFVLPDEEAEFTAFSTGKYTSLTPELVIAVRLKLKELFDAVAPA